MSKWRSILSFQVESKAPPGREKQVKKLKKKFPEESAYAIAWSQYNKKKKKKKS